MQGMPTVVKTGRFRTRRWQWWVGLGLIGVVYVAYMLPGRVSSDVHTFMRHWTGTGALPAKAMTPSPRNAHAWSNPLSPSGTLIRSFGWDRVHGVLTFSPQITVRVSHPAQVIAPVSATVASVSADSITLGIAGAPIQLQFQGLTRVDCRTSQHVRRYQVIGRTARNITIAVHRDRLPVNPLSSQYFGTQWLHR